MKDDKLCFTCEYNTQDEEIQFDKNGRYEIKSKCYTCWNNGVKKNYMEKESNNEEND